MMVAVIGLVLARGRAAGQRPTAAANAGGYKGGSRPPPVGWRWLALAGRWPVGLPGAPGVGPCRSLPAGRGDGYPGARTWGPFPRTQRRPPVGVWLGAATPLPHAGPGRWAESPRAHSS